MSLQANNNYANASDVNQYRHVPEDMAFTHKMDSLGTLQRELRSATMRNGSSFTTGNQMELILNMNQAARFANLRDSYLEVKCDYTTEGTNTQFTFEGRIGMFALIDNLLVETDSSTRFSYVTDVAELLSVELNKNVDNQYLDNTGSMLFGAASDPVAGETLANGVSAYKALPMGMLPSGVMKQKYWPMFGSENLRIVLDLNSALKAAIAENTGQGTATGITLSSIKFWYDVYTLTPSQYNGLVQDLGGVFKLYGSDWTHITDSMPANSLGIVTNLGIAKKKCKRVIAIVRAAADVASDVAPSITNRDQANISQFYLTLDDTIVGLKEIRHLGNGPIPYAEMMKANGGLLNVHTRNATPGYDLVEPTGVDVDNFGSYFMEIGLDNGFGSKNALSGLPCHSNAYFTIVKDTGVNAVETVDIYVEHIAEYILDLNQGGIWSVLG